MSHRFDRSENDPYVVAAEALADRLYTGDAGLGAGAHDQIFDTLSNAVVCALGDVAAQAFRNGVNSREEMQNLASAVAHACDAVFTAYRGEVDPEAALQAIESDPRVSTLTPEPAEKLQREIEKTRQFETLLLTAKRLPDLIDFAGLLGLEVHDELLDQGILLVGDSPTPTAPTV